MGSRHRRAQIMTNVLLLLTLSVVFPAAQYFFAPNSIRYRSKNEVR